jgi:hypothetical protein
MPERSYQREELTQQLERASEAREAARSVPRRHTGNTVAVEGAPVTAATRALVVLSSVEGVAASVRVDGFEHTPVLLWGAIALGVMLLATASMIQRSRGNGVGRLGIDWNSVLQQLQGREDTDTTAGGSPTAMTLPRAHGREQATARAEGGVDWESVQQQLGGVRTERVVGQPWRQQPRGQQSWILQPSTWSRRDRPATADMAPAQLLQHGRELQLAARAESTRTSYRHWWAVFANCCVEWGWARTATEIPLPVTTEVMLMWVALLSGKYAASSIGVSLAAISAVHRSHDLTSPSAVPAVLDALEGVARTATVNGVTDVFVITPDHVRMFLALTSVTAKGGKLWSPLRLKRGVAMACVGFLGFVRKGELDGFDACDVSRQHDGSTLVVKSAKNDQVGRGRSTVIGAGVGDAADAEQSLWTWMEAAGLRTSSAGCTKARWPSERCLSCGPLFPQLAGSDVRATKKPWGKSRVTEELRGLLGECVRLGWLPASFDVKRISGISLRRGGNSAAAAAGVSNLMRAAQGRWLCTETPDQRYTMLHRTEHVELATTIFEGRT